MQTNENVTKALSEIVSKLTEKDFIHTVNARGNEWDVYKFVGADKSIGTIAVRLDDSTKKVVVGALSRDLKAIKFQLMFPKR